MGYTGYTHNRIDSLIEKSGGRTTSEQLLFAIMKSLALVAYGKDGNRNVYACTIDTSMLIDKVLEIYSEIQLSDRGIE